MNNSTSATPMPIGEPKLRVTYYLHLPDASETEGTCEKQAEAVKAYIRCHPEWTLLPGYVDVVQPRQAQTNPPQFKQMLRDAAEDRFDLLVTPGFSPISRELLCTLQYAHQLRQHRVDEQIINRQFCSFGAEGRLYFLELIKSLEEEVMRVNHSQKSAEKSEYALSFAANNSIKKE